MTLKSTQYPAVRRGISGLFFGMVAVALMTASGCGNKTDDAAAPAASAPAGGTVAPAPGAPGAPAAPGNMNANSASDAAQRKAAEDRAKAAGK